MFLAELCCTLAVVFILAASRGDGDRFWPLSPFKKESLLCLSWGQVVRALNGEGWATLVWKTKNFEDIHHPKLPDVPIPCVRVLVQVFSTSALTLT